MVAVNHSTFKENYFTIFEIETCFEINENDLLKNYLKLQKKYHPDNYINYSNEDKILAINNIMLINKAYEILKNKRKRAQYLLEINGYFVNGENDNIKPENSLLAEIMEWRELIDEAMTCEELDQVKQKLPKENELITNFKIKYKEKDFIQAGLEIIKLRYLEKTIEEIKLKNKT